MVVEKMQVKPSWKTSLHVDGKDYRSSMDFFVTKQDYDKAFQDLSESEDVRTKSLETLRKKLSSDADIVSRQDEEYLLRYLRYSKYDCNRAYNMIRKVYAERAKHPHLFTLSPNLKFMLDRNIIRWLPYTDEEGRVVFIMQFGHWNLEEMSAHDMLAVINAASDVITMNPMIQIHGCVGIWDFDGFSASHLAHIMHPQRLMAAINTIQNFHPWRIKMIAAVNVNMLCRSAYRSVRYLLKKKVQERVLILESDLTELHKHFNLAILPKEYGGYLEDKELSITDIVMHNLSYLKYERTFGH